MQLRQTCWKIFRRKSKIRIQSFFKKSVFPKKNGSSGHKECSFDNGAETLLLKVEAVFAQIPKRFLKNFSQENKLYPDVHQKTYYAILTNRMKLFFGKKSNEFTPKNGKNRKSDFLNENSSICSSGHKKCSFDNLAENF